MKTLTKILTAILLSVHSPILAQFSVDFNIDVSKNKKTISPLIYGTNDRYAHAKAKRLGGNRLTNFNWENNASNGGFDYINSNDGYIPWQQGVADADYNIPGATLKAFHTQSIKQNAYSLITLPMAKFVAGDLNGEVFPSQTPPSNRWKKVFNIKPGPLNLNPDQNDGNVYLDEEVNFLIQNYGLSKSVTGVKGYALDNEPGIWFHSHPILWGMEHTKVRYLMDNSFELAHRIKVLDADAEIFGPASWGVAEFENLQFAPDWDTENAGAYPNFLAYYLSKMKQRAEASPSKKRLLDVLDLHWYPQTNNDGTDPFGGGNDFKTNEIRMEMTRSLWDPTYIENTWIGQDEAKRSQFLPFLPKMKALINQYYQGTKLALSEYSYMGVTHASGGIAQADALGIFGQQEVYLATYWGGIDGYIKTAFDTYVNYDGKGGSFGDISVEAQTTDIQLSSIFASTESNDLDKAHVIAINKSQNQRMIANFKIAGNNFKSARIWGFDSSSPVLKQLKNIRTISSNEFSYEIPPLTVLHFVLSKEDLSVQPEFESANITPAAGYSDGKASFQIKADIEDGDKNIISVTADLSGVGGDSKAQMALDDALEMRYHLDYNLSASVSSGLKNIKLTATDAQGNTAESNVSYRVIKKVLPKVLWDGDAVKIGKGEAFYDANDSHHSQIFIGQHAQGGNIAPGSMYMHFAHDAGAYNLMTFRLSENNNPVDAKDISDYGFLEFYLKSNGSNNADIEFSLRDASPQMNVSSTIRLRSGGYITEFNSAGYSRVRIPLSDLVTGSDVDLRQIWQFNFLSNTADPGFEVWADDFRVLPYPHPEHSPMLSDISLSPVYAYPDGTTPIALKVKVVDPDSDLDVVYADLSELGGQLQQPLMKTGNEYSIEFMIPVGISHGVKKLILTAKDQDENFTDAILPFTVLQIAGSQVIWDGDTKNTGVNIETNPNTKITVVQNGGNKGPINMSVQMDQMNDGFAAATWDWNEGTGNAQMKDFSDKRFLKFAIKVIPPDNNFDMELYIKDFELNSSPSIGVKAGGYVQSFTGDYQWVSVPISDLLRNSNVNPKRITRMGLLTNRLGSKKLTFSLDDIHASGSLRAEVEIVKTDASCKGLGKITVNSIINEQGPFSYYLNGQSNPAGIHSPSFNNVTVGKHLLRITNASGFIYMEEVVIGGDESQIRLNATTTPGNIDLSVSGGSGAYSYLWSTGQTTQDLSDLSEGKYTVAVTDLKNGCSAILEIVLQYARDVEVLVQDAICAGTGSITITKTIGLSGKLSYYLDGVLYSEGAQYPVFGKLLPGIFTLKVIDSKGNTVEKRIDVKNTGNPPLLSYTLGVDYIDLTVLPSNSNYRYSWSNGTTIQDPTALTTGKYTVTVMDINSGCIQNLEIDFVKGDASVLIQHLSCKYNGEVQVIGVQGGKGIYSYYLDGLLNPAGANNPIFSNVRAGDHILNVEDGASFVLTRALNVNDERRLPVATASINGNIVSINATGGSGNYSFLWPDGDKGRERQNLKAGRYSVRVEDMLNGCITDAIIDVPLRVEVSQTNPNCANNGKINLNVLNAGEQVNYYINSLANPAGIGNSEFSSLAPGSYTVSIKTISGITWEINTILTGPNNGPMISLTTAAGKIMSQISGGSGNYGYLWSNGATSSEIYGLKAGIYTLTVKDFSTGCTSSKQVVLERAGISKSEVLVYPNPVSHMGLLKVKFEFPDSKNKQILIRDLLGQTRWQGIAQGSWGEIEIPVSNLNTGIYFLVVYDDKPIMRQFIVF